MWRQPPVLVLVPISRPPEEENHPDPILGVRKSGPWRFAGSPALLDAFCGCVCSTASLVRG
eukprot:4404572-Pyramimonas_sp.AAC.1